MPRRLLVILVLAVALSGCAAEGASPRNFTLTPNAVGWYAGEETSFNLTLGATMLRGMPTVEIDRRFVIEEIRLEQQEASFGGDHQTRDPDGVQLKLVRDGVQTEKVTLDAQNASVEMRLTLPQDLHDSEYVLELKLFQIGWVKSAPFRVDHRS